MTLRFGGWLVKLLPRLIKASAVNIRCSLRRCPMARESRFVRLRQLAAT
jgi:hypothetical protein